MNDRLVSKNALHWQNRTRTGKVGMAGARLRCGQRAHDKFCKKVHGEQCGGNLVESTRIGWSAGTKASRRGGRRPGIFATTYSHLQPIELGPLSLEGRWMDGRRNVVEDGVARVLEADRQVARLRDLPRKDRIDSLGDVTQVGLPAGLCIRSASRAGSDRGGVCLYCAAEEAAQGKKKPRCFGGASGSYAGAWRPGPPYAAEHITRKRQ